MDEQTEPTPGQRAARVMNTKLEGPEQFEALVAEEIRAAQNDVLMVLAPFAMHAKALALEGRPLSETVYQSGNSALCVGAFEMARDMCFGEWARASGFCGDD